MKRNKTYRRLIVFVAVFQLISLFFNGKVMAAQDTESLGAYNKTENFGVANDFNIFLFGDHKQSSVDVGGRVAVGGNAVYNNYSIGSRQDVSKTRADLIVGGDTDITSGMNFSGRTILSSTGKVIRYTMINNNVSPARPVYSTESLIDFAAEKQKLIADSRYWAGLAVNGSVKVQYGQLILQGDDPALNIFSFDGTNIEGSGESMLTINCINIIVPDNSTVIVNIKGDNIGFGSYSILSSGKATPISSEQKYVWNFYEARSLKNMSLSICGSVLAPQADWRAVGSANIEGNFIANSLKNDGGTLEAHSYLFNGHLPKNPGKRVLLISIDGLHALDLANYIENNPGSALSYLSNRGITYSNAASSKPSDSFPGLLSLITGGSANSTGVFYHDSYDRRLLPPVSANAGDRPGTRVLYDESIDKDPTRIDGGGGINPDALPRDPDTKQPVYPHSFLKVNTVFEAVKASRCRTAWIDENPAYDLVNGPSGKGVDDLFTPEIAANGNAASNVDSIEAYDDLKVEALINEIDGFDHTGTTFTSVPTLFGMSFQAVGVAQKLHGYLDGGGTLSKGLEDALGHTDKSLGKIIEELKKQNIFDSTIIIITAKHGQSPVDPSKSRIIDKQQIIDGVPSGLISQMTADDVALIWLADQSKTNSVLAAVANNREKAGIKDIYSYSAAESEWLFNDPAADSRAPDIIVQPNDGVIYTEAGKEVVAHGGFTEDDTHVALLISFDGIKNARENIAAVQTAQVAPTILKFLGMEPDLLQAVRKENTQVLPGLFLSDIQAVIESIKGEPSGQELYEKAAELYVKDNDKGYKVFVNGDLIDFSRYSNVKPEAAGGRTMVPLTAIAESLGAKVEWDGSANIIAMTLNETVIKLTPGSNIAYINGEKHELDVPVKIAGGRTLVPLRFISESFGEKVGWYSLKDIKVISIYN